MATKLPNWHKIFQMTTKLPNVSNGHKINQHFLFQGPTKYTQIVIFWSKNKPSGNPELRCAKHWEGLTAG
jgi:hypothetical protein